jgi:predicted permease
MGWTRSIVTLLQRLSRRRHEEDLDRELRSHLDLEAEQQQEAGAPPDEAQYAAQRAFGNVTLVKEDIREMWKRTSLEILLKDGHYALRTLRANPLFTLTAVLSLALGMGANTAIFTLLRVSLWKPLPVKEPHQVFHVMRSQPGSEPDREFGYSYVLLRELSEAARSSGDIFAKAAFGLRKFGIDVDSTERVAGEPVSANFFSALRVRPALGRVLESRDDNVFGGNRVAVLSHAFWTRRFRSSPAVLGKAILYNETPYTVVGVAQPGFTGVEAQTPIDIWVPVTADADKAWLNKAHNSWLTLFMRLGPGSDPERVQGVLEAVFQAHLKREILPGVSPHFRPILGGQHITLRPASSGLSMIGRRYEKPLLLLMAVVALVLLVSCANVANLIMARNASRQREINIRLAIGASRRRIVSQLFTEALLIALLGAVCGVLVASWACRLLISLLPESQVPLVFDLRPDSTVLGFTAGVAIVTAILFGLAPAMRACRTDGTLISQSGTRTTARSLNGKMLVAGQLALSLLLLIGAGLFLQTIRNLRSIDLGFRPQNVMTFDLSFPRGTSAERIRQAYQQIQERLESHPGFFSASYAWPGIYDSGGWSSRAEAEGRPAAPGEDNEVGLIAVGADFFETIGLSLLQGRYLNRHDLNGSPVAVVNERLARHYFGDTSPIGRHIKLPGNKPELREIVGVVRDAKHYGAREHPWRMVYLPGAKEGSFLVRSLADSPLVSAYVREVVSAADRTAQIERIRQLPAVVEGTFSRERLIAFLSTAFGALATLLACIGLYGVTAYHLSQRTSELGIRMALGAQAGHIKWLAFRETLLLVLSGSAIGIGGAVAATRYVSSMLYGVQPAEGSVFAGSILLLSTVALAAGFLPAWRASRIDPLTALRHE